MDWQQWPSVSLGDRQLLPNVSGIYIVADQTKFVWYVGQAIDLQTRWLGRGHHRYPQLIRTNKKLGHRIYWHAVSVPQLNEQERFYIDLFKPELNGCKVKSYLPKQPQVDREIKRLFKVLNRPTMLFPIIRSAIAGAYRDEDGVECVVTLIHINDFRLLGKSVKKRYSAEVRRDWFCLDTHCGKSPNHYHSHQVYSYHLPTQRFEFVNGSDILSYLEDNPNVYERVVGTTNLFGVEANALRELSVLDEVTLGEKYTFLLFATAKERSQMRLISSTSDRSSTPWETVATAAGAELLEGFIALDPLVAARTLRRQRSRGSSDRRPQCPYRSPSAHQ